MSSIHHSCECLVLRTPPRAPAPRPAVLNIIALILEAFQEAAEMRRDVHQKYPFDNE